MIDHESALIAIDFIQSLKLSTDPFYGKPFELLDWQYQTIYDVYGTMNEKGQRKYRYVYIETPKKMGKALSIDTPIPTPSGWIAMARLNVGDIVFDENGNPCKVTFATEIMHGHKCYHVCFSDGSDIVADADHQWLTNAWIDRPNQGRPCTPRNQGERRYGGSITRIRTTEEISNSLKVQGTTNNHSVQTCGALNLPEIELPIPPYTLGAWLGDGCSGRASVVCSDADYEIIEAIQREGVPIKRYKTDNRIAEYGLTTGTRSGADRASSVQKALREMVLLNNKHIPATYLRASARQRMELLRGLMDTDGYAEKKGHCEFTTVKPQLRDGVMELLNSLGYKATTITETAKIYGRDCGLKYRIRFYAHADNPCFNLRRKASRLKPKSKNTRSGVRHITDVIEIASVPVRCIQTDSPNHLYLAGPSMIPTHNTELVAATGLYHTFFDGVMHGEVYGCAAEKKQAAKAFNAAIIMIQQNKFLSKRAKIIESQKTIIDKTTGTVFTVLSAEAYSKHGLNVSACIFDELHAQPDRRLWDVMTFGSGSTRRQPIWWIITTAGDDADRTSIGWEIHEYARKVRDGEKIDPAWYVKIYGAPNDADIYDEKVWHACNPSLGHTVQIEEVRQEALAARNSPGSEKLFRWLRLNQWVSLKSTSWLPLTLWDTTTGELTKADLVDKRCYAGIDLSTINDLTGIALLFPPQKGIEWDQPTGLYDENNQPLMSKKQGWYFVTYAFHPLENMKQRILTDHVPYDEWAADRWLDATPGNVIDYTFVQAKIQQIARQYDVVAWGNDPRGAEKLRQDLLNIPVDADGNGPIELTEVPQDIKTLSEPMKEIERLSKLGEMKHERNPLGRWCWGNVTVYVDGNGNYKPLKNKPVDKIDPMAALFNAMVLAMKIETVNIYDIRGMRSLG